MGLTCSQSTTRTKPHLPFGETRPPSIPSRPPPALLQSPSFQLPSSTCKPKHTTTITAVGTNTRGQYRSTISSRSRLHLHTKPLAAGHRHRLPSSPLICRGAAGQPPCPASLPLSKSACLVLALPSEDLFLHDLQCWARWSALPCTPCLCLAALAALPAQKRQSVSRSAMRDEWCRGQNALALAGPHPHSSAQHVSPATNATTTPSRACVPDSGISSRKEKNLQPALLAQESHTRANTGPPDGLAAWQPVITTHCIRGAPCLPRRPSRIPTMEAHNIA